MQGSSTARDQGPGAAAQLRFAGVLAGVVGRSAARRAVPVFAGLAITCAVLFGPSGMRAETLVSSFRDGIGFRVGLLAGWLALVMPASTAMFRDRDSEYLRSLPVPAVVWWLVLVALCLVIQLPWAALWIAGGTGAEAVGAVSVSAAICSLFATPPRSHVERLLGFCVLAALVYFVFAQPVSLWMTLGVPCFLIATVVAWLRAPDRARPWDPLSVRGGRVTALCLTHVASVWRTSRASMGRAVVVAAAGAGLAALTARTNQLETAEELAAFAMVIGSVSFAIVAGVLSAPLQEAQRSCRWLLDSTGTGGGARMVATAGVLGVFMLLVGVGHGVFAATAVGAPAIAVAKVAALCGAWAAAFGLLAARAARMAEAVDGVDGTRLVSLVVAATALSIVLLGWLGLSAAVVWPTAGIAAAGTSVAAAPSTRVRSRRVRRW